MNSPGQLMLFPMGGRWPSRNSRAECLRCDRFVNSTSLLWCDKCAAALMANDRKTAEEEAR